jgi:hypothetical protein
MAAKFFTIPGADHRKAGKAAVQRDLALTTTHPSGMYASCLHASIAASARRNPLTRTNAWGAMSRNSRQFMHRLLPGAAGVQRAALPV